MKSGRVEIGAVGPDKRFRLIIEAYLVEDTRIGEGAEYFAQKNSPKINHPSHPVLETDPQGKRSYLFEANDRVNLMSHVATSRVLS